MPTFDMLNKNYYSHCPLKKRPIKKEEPEPENLSTKPEDLQHHSKKLSLKVEKQPSVKFKTISKYEDESTSGYYQQKLWPLPPQLVPTTFYPFQLYNALLPCRESYELLNYSQLKVSRDSSLSPPAPAFIEPIKLVEKAKVNHRHVPYHPNLLLSSPTSQHLSLDAFTSQSVPFRKTTSAKILTDFKIGTLLKSSIVNEEKVEMKSENTRYQCPDCKKSYSTYSGLVKHQQFHCLTSCEKKVQKIVSCDECGKTYASTGALKMHIRTHTLPCKCHLCGKAFSRPWLLQGHIRTHTGEKPFSCNYCHRAFADRSNLRAHLQTHSDVKKYSCLICNKTFSRMSLLTKHNESACHKLL